MNKLIFIFILMNLLLLTSKFPFLKSTQWNGKWLFLSVLSSTDWQKSDRLTDIHTDGLTDCPSFKSSIIHMLYGTNYFCIFFQTRCPHQLSFLRLCICALCVLHRNRTHLVILVSLTMKPISMYSNLIDS